VNVMFQLEVRVNSLLTFLKFSSAFCTFINVRFEVFDIMKITVFWNVKSCIFISMYQTIWLNGKFVPFCRSN
jgi:hypothetical protein